MDYVSRDILTSCYSRTDMAYRGNLLPCRAYACACACACACELSSSSPDRAHCRMLIGTPSERQAVPVGGLS
jgi:hypothetical protein